MTMQQQQTTLGTALATLTALIVQHGEIRTVRVSSARARGAAKRYAYWGAVRYAIRLAVRGGYPTHVPLECASSDRRSRRLAEQDARTIAAAGDRVYVEMGPGRVSEEGAAVIVGRLACVCP